MTSELIMIENLSTKQRWIYSSAAIAIFSMFLPWATLGMRSDDGWETQYFFFLVFWVFPCINVLKNYGWTIVSKLSILAGITALVILSNDREIDFFGNTYSWKIGAGLYIYFCAWMMAIYAEFFISNNSKDNLSHNSTATETSDENFYLKAIEEFNSDLRRRPLWEKCLTVCDGDEKKAERRYIHSRVKSWKSQPPIPQKSPSPFSVITDFKTKLNPLINKGTNSYSKFITGNYGSLKTFSFTLFTTLSLLILSFLSELFLWLGLFVNISGIIGTWGSTKQSKGGKVWTALAIMIMTLCVLIFAFVIFVNYESARYILEQP